MTTLRPYAQVDVFTATPYLGNPLAVVLDGTGLSTEDMQRFACWTNLSETTFVLPPTPDGAATGADYKVRIFTPGGELPFAGHPTLGTCHAWLQAGGTPHHIDAVVQECGVGLVRIHQNNGPAGKQWAFAAPALTRHAPDEASLAAVATALGLPLTRVVAAQCLDNGPLWLGLLVDRPDTVQALTPDHAALKRLGYKVGVAAIQPRPDDGEILIKRASREARAFATSARHLTTPAPADFDLLVRAFAAPVGVNEDPVTGSLNASLAQWLMADGHLPDAYVAAQGQALARDGRVHLSRDATGQVWVGGASVTCITGTVQL